MSLERRVRQGGHEEVMRQARARLVKAVKREVPEGFWKLILAAVVIGNVGLLALLRLGAPDWLAVATPIFTVGLAGVIIEYRRRLARRDES